MSPRTTQSSENDRPNGTLDGGISGGDGSTPSERIADAAIGAKQQAESLYRDASSAARQQAQSMYDDASSAAAEASYAIDDAADRLANTGHETLSQAAAMLSDRVRAFSGYLEDRRIEDLIGDARRLAQRNPGLFIAGGLALGFALSRVLKAGAADASRSARNIS